MRTRRPLELCATSSSARVRVHANRTAQRFARFKAACRSPGALSHPPRRPRFRPRSAALLRRVVNRPDLDGGDVVVQHVGADLLGAVERLAIDLVIGGEMLPVIAPAGKGAPPDHK